LHDDCLFCRIAAGELPSKNYYEDEDVVAFADINPVAPVHILVVPRKHIASLSEATQEDAALLGKMQLVSARLGDEMLGGQYRVVFNNGEEAGQTVRHIHCHLIGGRALAWPPG